MKFRHITLLAGTCLGSLALVAPATAEEAKTDAATKSEKEDNNIVVTGTLIRGIAPAGTETLTITPQNIAEAGGNTVQDVLAKVPQLSFFNRQPTSGMDMGVGQRQKAQQPRIHGLPSLILLDGRRIASAVSSAAEASSLDPSIIPTGVLNGIEIVPDGGSATYGSDAVGGVVNMTTLRRFDGVKLDGTVSFADSYKAYRGNVTVGKDWGSGSIFAAYSYSQSDALLGSKRPWIGQTAPVLGCTPGNITYGSTLFSYPSTGADGKPTSFTNGASRCNRYPNESVLPAQIMHSAFAGLSQQLSPWLSVDLRAFYSTRSSTAYHADSLTSNFTFNTAALRSTPYFTVVTGQSATASQKVDFTLQPAVGPNTPATTRLENWGVSGEFKASLFADFQARLLGNYNQSAYRAKSVEGIDSTILASAVASGAFDVYNPAFNAASIQAAQQMANRPTSDFGNIAQTQLRTIVDGTLMQINGNSVKVAAGAEMVFESFYSLNKTRNYLDTVIATIPDVDVSASRRVLSAFGELEVPLITPGNGGPIHELRFSAAGRYDHYSDFGSTFNPRFAATISPFEGLSFRATYGTSFVAPALAQLYAAQKITQSNFFLVLPPGATSILVLQGGNPNLKPQKAKTWSFGADLALPALDGLKLSVTYYKANFTNQIGGAPVITQPALWHVPTYAAFYIDNPTQQQVLDFVGGPAPFSGLANCPTLASLYDAAGTCPAASRNPGAVYSTRSGNIGTVKTDGIDFSAEFRRPTSFGSVEFRVGGNYILDNDVSSDDVTFTNQLLTSTSFNATASAAANVGNFRATATLLHTGGFLLPVPLATTQDKVGSYDTIDTYFSYTFKERGILANTVVSLQISNLFNVKPPVNLTAATGYGSGNVLGRTFQLGLSKKF